MIALIIIIIPLVCALLVFILGKRLNLYNSITVIATVATWGLSLTLVPVVKQAPLELTLEGFLAIGLFIKVDLLSLVFLLLFSTVWSLSTIHAVYYMSVEHKQPRFFTFLLITYAGCLGVVLAGDFFTLFLFFELMTFASYVLVIHEEDPDAMSAGLLFLFLGVIGGLALLFGIILLYDQAQTMAFVNMSAYFADAPIKQVMTLLLFLLGFGLKAGMFPLHVWLPKAHPVAPSPASALLSGIMIKTGAYGLIRVFLNVFGWQSESSTVFERIMVPFGFNIIWIGIITMLLGAYLALLQTSAKKILAYSSVSQIGYIIMGIGAAIYLGNAGAMSMAGVIYHIINHALFKATLFLCVGAIYIYTHELDITKLGGLRHKYRFIMVVFIVAALGIVGMPGFNGYASKSILHHAIEEAYQHGNLLSLWWAEKLFVLASALTVCYFLKLFRGLFGGKLPERYKKLPRPFFGIQAVLAVFASLMLFIGLMPTWLLRGTIIPTISIFTFDPYKVNYVAKLTVWNRQDIMGMVITFALAGLIYVAYEKFNLYRFRPPLWLSIENLFYLPMAKGFLYLCRGPSVALDRTVSNLYRDTGKVSMNLFKQIGEAEQSFDQVYNRAGRGSRFVCKSLNDLEQAANQLLNTTSTKSLGKNALKHLQESKKAEHVRPCDPMVQLLKQKPGISTDEKPYKIGDCPFAPGVKCLQHKTTFWERHATKPEWNLKNLNFEGIIVSTLFALILLILFFFRNRLSLL